MGKGLESAALVERIELQMDCIGLSEFPVDRSCLYGGGLY